MEVHFIDTTHDLYQRSQFICQFLEMPKTKETKKGETSPICVDQAKGPRGGSVSTKGGRVFGDKS